MCNQLNFLKMSTFQRLKQIDTKTKNLINGYIRECQDKLFGDVACENAYYNIPQLINTHCMAFYEIFTWYKQNPSKNLQFISDSEVTIKKQSGWRICLFENVISNEICNKFSITFKLISFGDSRKKLDFCIGFTTANTLEESVINWNQCLGEEDNKTTSASWAFWQSSLIYNGKGYSGKHVQKSGSMNYSIGDLFKVSFDFQAQDVKLHHNDKEVDSKPLITTKLWIGLSLKFKGNQIKMVEYKYD